MTILLHTTESDVQTKRYFFKRKSNEENLVIPDENKIGKNTIVMPRYPAWRIILISFENYLAFLQ